MTDHADHSSEALFRFIVVSNVVARLQREDCAADAIHAVAAETHVLLDGSLRRVSERSIYRWLAAYRDAGMGGLERGPRRGVLKALSAAFIDFLVMVTVRSDPSRILPATGGGWLPAPRSGLGRLSGRENSRRRS